MQNRKTILIIDEMPVSADLLSYFAKFEFQVIQQKKWPKSGPLDFLPVALLLDWSIVKANIKSLTTLTSSVPNIPIIIFSAEENEQACIQALEAGADDFLLKSRNPREIHARINAVIRRIERANTKAQDKEVLMFGKWTLYPGSRQLYQDNQECKLSLSEYNLLLAFVRQPQKTLSRDYLWQILNPIFNKPLSPRHMDAHISRLRQKIETDPQFPKLIKTIRSKGYIFSGKVIAGKKNRR